MAGNAYETGEKSVMKTPTFELLESSKYPIPAGLQTICGYVTVPEARSAASGLRGEEYTLRIYVTVVKSFNPDPAPDPVVFLYGGPGGNSAGVLRMLKEPHLARAFLGRSDLVVFDQRGTGFSEPALFAPEVDALEWDALLTDLDPDARRERYVRAVLDARQRFADLGVNLAAINTPEIVSDMEDVRLALGYEKLNLFGISYGTRPALAAMRDFPGSIRSVVLDSTVPVQVSQYVEAIPNAQRSFELLFDAAASDPQANRAYPQLGQVFYEVFDMLSQEPVLRPAKHPQTGAEITLHLTADVFLGFFCNGFYSAESIARMPAAIYKAYQGDFSPIAEKYLHYLEDSPSDLPGFSLGMYYSVNCCDDKVDAQTALEIRRWAQKHPAMRSLALSEFHLGEYVAKIGEAWGARKPGPQEYQPVCSDIPTLILAGQLDQNTPAAWGRLAAETLPNSQHVEFSGMGHGVIREGDCAAKLLAQFYARPDAEADTGCLEKGSFWVE